MNQQIIGLAPGLAPSLDPWLQKGSGEYARNWLQIEFDREVQDIFGYHALQLGATSINTLSTSRIAHRWCAADSDNDPHASLYANASALPFFESTLDLVTLPFTLDMHSDPDAVLDEVARVVVPEGRVVIAGFNGASLWGLSHKLGSSFLPEGVHIFGYHSLRSALNELGLVIETVRFGGYVPPVKTLEAAQNYAWLDKIGSKWWTSLGSMYFIVAKKRVMGVRPHRRAELKLFSRARFGLPLHQPSLNKTDQSIDG